MVNRSSTSKPRVPRSELSLFRDHIRSSGSMPQLLFLPRVEKGLYFPGTEREELVPSRPLCLQEGDYCVLQELPREADACG